MIEGRGIDGGPGGRSGTPMGRPAQSPISDAKRVRAALRQVHLKSAEAPIQGPDGQGRFPSATGWHRDVSPVVVDANWLRNDVLRAARGGPPTVLVNLANQQSARPFCAPHVLEEVDEHRDEWCRDAGVAPDQFISVWQRWYVPLIRCVEPPEEMLSPAEKARIDLLRTRDPDDVPSACLAMLLGAAFISSDGPAAEAVYGCPPGQRPDELLAFLLGLGDEALLEQQLIILSHLTVTAGVGAFRMGSAALRVSPWLIAAAAMLGVWAATRVRPETWRTIGTTVMDVAEWASDPMLYLQSLKAARTGRTPSGAARGLAGTPRAGFPAPTRACMLAMARAPQGQMSVAELLEVLPVGVATAVAVREALRQASPGTFVETSRGRWQLGRPWSK